MKFSSLVATGALALLLTRPARAESPGDLANPRVSKTWVNDNAGVLDAQTERKINDLLTPLYRKTGAQIAIATVNDLGGESVEDFSIDLARRWKIGSKAKDNGVLLLVAVRDHEMRIETGYGADAPITDAQAKEITGKIIKPAFKRGDYKSGIYDGTYAIARRFDPSLPTRQMAPANSSKSQSNSGAPTNDSPFRVPDESSPSEIPFDSPDYGQPAPSSGGGGGALLLALLVLGGGGVIALSALGSRPPRCPRCKGAMELVPENQEDPYLTDVQQLEESLGGREWNVWRCPRDGYIALMPHDKWMSGVEVCPRCQNRTATSNTQTLQFATEFQNGLQQTTHLCHNPACRYSWMTQQTIPRQMPVVIVTGGGHHHGGGFGGSSGGGFDSGSSSSGSYDSGPSDFGGGDFGGGGASDSW